MEGVKRLQLSRVISLFGGTYEESLMDGVSILVSGTPTPRADRLAGAKKLNIPIISIKWVWACMDSNSLVAYDKFLISASSSKPQTRSDDGFGSFETTKTLTIPSGDVERRISER